MTAGTHLDGTLLLDIERFGNHLLGPDGATVVVGTDANATIATVTWPFEQCEFRVAEHAFVAGIEGDHDGWGVGVGGGAGFFFGAEAECLDGEIVVTAIAVAGAVGVGIANGIGELGIGVDGDDP